MIRVYLRAYRADEAVAWWWLADTVKHGDTVTAEEGMVNLGVDVEWALTDGDGTELTERKASVQGRSPELSFTRA